MNNAQLLLVDDDRLILHTLSIGLREAGFSVIEADSGESALKIAGNAKIDLAVVDVRMSGMSGLELAEQWLKRMDIPCVFLSAYSDIAIVERAVSAGALGYLIKPLDVENIVPSIKAALVRANELSRLKKTCAEQNIAMDEVRADSAARLAGLVDSAMDAIITVDDSFRIVVFNPAAELLFSCNAAEALGQELDRFIPEPLRAAHRGHMQSFAATSAKAREMHERREMSGLRSDGAQFPAEATISSATIHGKKQFTVIMRDISEKKRAETIRLQLENQLRESQKMEAIGTLAGGIAHDFNNIVAAILGNVALARGQVTAGQRTIECLDEIEKAGARARSLVSQILSFSSKQPLEMVEQPLGPLADEAGNLLRATLPSNIDLAVSSTLPVRVRCDATQIIQVVLNLGTNARQSMAGRAGRIDIKLDEAFYDTETARQYGLAPGPYAHLSVCDNGQGMDEATQARIFEPFFTTKARGIGTGLGLAVANGIVKAHRGTIRVNSKPGEGTIFHLYFPAVTTRPVTAQPEAVDRKQAPGRGQHLLYVDDDEAMRFLLTRLLESDGYRVSAYENAEVALTAVKAQPAGFDLAITDFNMPKMSGLDFARELSRLNRDIPVVIASGYVTEELKESARLLGVCQVIYKPNTIDELGKIVESLLDTANTGSRK